MKYENNKVSDINIAYIGGGSRGWAWTFMTDLALEPKLCGSVKLYDLDVNSAKMNESLGNRITAHTDTVGKWSYSTVISLREALIGADFVVISILPGTFDEMESDVHLPERLNIYQSVGDTAGPGGIVRALRTIPMFQEIAENIKEYAPDAWVINYTNPMSLCVKTLYEIFPKIKAFGCCHEVFGTQKILVAMCKEELGIQEVTQKDIHVNVLGINHFTWFDEASYKGIDLLPVYQRFVDKHYEEGFHEPDNNWANSTFDCAHRVKFDLFRKYHLIAAAGDRHLAEFMPGNDYLKDPDTVADWRFCLTPVSWRKKDLEARLVRSNRLFHEEEDIFLSPSGEEGILLIKALCGLERVISNVNIPNSNRQITNLSSTAVVETNAVFGLDSIRPIIAGELPKGILALIAPHVQNHEYILQAALHCNLDLAFKAFMNDPLVKDRCTDTEGLQLLKDMIHNTIRYLPNQWAELV